MKKIQVIIRKEWAEVFKNRLVFFSVAFMPLLFSILPLVILYMMRSSGEVGDISTSDIPPQFAPLCEGLGGEACMQYFIVNQFLFMFMLVPVIIPITIASYSIVGEKTTRTLEPLLATPITTIELLAGKALAATLPAVIATWGCFLIFAIGSRLLATGPGVTAKLFDPLWLTAIFLVGPLLAIAAVSAAVMVSSRANEPRAAEQIAMLVILPLLALFFLQITGYLLLDERLILLLAAVLTVIDAGLLFFATQLFQRETILTRWK